jgi:hypothetical protein
MAESAELVVSKHSVWTPEKKDFTFMGHTVEGDLANLMQFAELVSRAEREACANTAGLALLGADKALSDRVLKAIRARGQA